MAEYKIAKVSEKEPRKWEGRNGTVYYIKVMLEGHDRPVSIGKKSPDALKAGDTVYGTINADPDHEEDKFKSEAKPFGGGGKSQPKDEEAIARAVALKAAVDFGSDDKEALSILAIADVFLEWLKQRPDEPEAPKEDF